MRKLAWIIVGLASLPGCATSPHQTATNGTLPAAVPPESSEPFRSADPGSDSPSDKLANSRNEIDRAAEDVEPSTAMLAADSGIQPASATQVEEYEPSADAPDVPVESVDPGPSAALLLPDPPSIEGKLSLAQVIDSIHLSYPAVEGAYHGRNVAFGNQLAASGEFDLKVKAASENGPTGFYQTYRQSVGVYQPTYSGGEIFANYRIGRGDFQPWYLERQTNNGGEFKAGLSVPLLRNRNVDARRAALWRASYDRLIVEPDIRAQLIEFVRDGSYAYWKWVAAGRRYQIANAVFKKAEDRNRGIVRMFEEGAIGRPDVDDNEQMMLLREAKLVDAGRKLQQSAIKLSLYWRDLDANVLIPSPEQLPSFPIPGDVDRDQMQADIQMALARRPEIELLDLVRRQYDVDYAEAHNNMRPEVNALLMASQDVGQATSKKRDKSEFELEAGLFMEVPVQRRKARGKMASVQGKLAQLAAKRKLVEDKIVTDVQAAYAALQAARSRVTKTQEAVVRLNKLAAVERRKYETGESDLLKVNLREQYAAEAELYAVDALEDFYMAEADLRAALAYDRIERVTTPPEPVSE